jgi:hypothetical protein
VGVGLSTLHAKHHNPPIKTHPYGSIGSLIFIESIDSRDGFSLAIEVPHFGSA